MKTFKEQMKKLTNILDANNIKHQEDEDYSRVSILGKRDYDITYNTNPNYSKGVGYFVTYVAPNGSEGTPIFAKTFELLLDILYRKGIIKNKATASAERKFRFKDGSVITASTAEEAKQKHKVIAHTDELGKLLEEIGILGKGNIRYEYTAPGKYDLVLNAERNYDFDGMWLGSITTDNGTKNYLFHTKNLECTIDKTNATRIKDKINKLIQFEIDRMKEEQDYLKSLKFKDGSIITASTAEEAKAKHKVMAADNEAQDASKVKDSIKKVLSSLGLSYTEDNLGDFSVKTIFGKVKIDFYEDRNNIKVRWSNIFSKIYGEDDDDVSYSLKISDSNSASKIKEMLVDILKSAELDEKVNKKYASSAPSGL